MDKNEDLKQLIEAFRGYRDLLTPIQTGLGEFLASYESVREDIDKLNASFDGEAQESMKSIAKTLAAQAEKSTDLSSRIDQFVRTTNKYVAQVGELSALIEKAEQRIATVNALEKQASEQIQRLDTLIEEKKINYNLRDLQRSIEGYDSNVRKVSDFINKDVASVLSDNAKKIEQIRTGTATLSEEIASEHDSVEQLLETNRANNELLRKIAETNDVNEEYIFDVLDKWAESRKVKTKRR